MKKEVRHKIIIILVSFTDGKPRFLTVRDRRHKEWIFITGGCRKREYTNPFRSALRELEEETRGTISLKRCEYSHFQFQYNTRTHEETLQDLKQGLDVSIIYHVYIVDYPVSRSVQLNLIKKFNDEKTRMDVRKVKNLPIRKTYDENDMMSFDTLDEFSKKNRWSFIVNNVINNQDFYSALNNKNKESFIY